jgi:hypothetical protein
VLRAQALLGVGRAEEARALARSAVERMAAQFAADAEIMGRARRVLGEDQDPSA